MKSILDLDFSEQMEISVRSFIKERIEVIMKEELTNFLSVEQKDERNSRNGYYERGLDTRYGKIDNLSVPRDRNGEFQTQVFPPYQRRDGWLEEAVIRMYQHGMSTRQIGDFIERILGTEYSATSISNITNTVIADIESWQTRPLSKRYSVLYLDGLYFNLRRDSVAKEVIYVILGINEEGYREIIGFYVGGNESASGWRELLQNIYKRGATEILLGVFDGLTGLEEAFHSVYPQADVQRCVVHKIRNTMHKVRVKDKPEFIQGLKKVYKADNKETALQQFEQMKKDWGKIYPREIASWEEDLPVLLTFYKYPEAIREKIYTTNSIERTIKEIRKRLYPMNSLTNIQAAEKIVYFTVKDFNERWSLRKVRGFSDPEVCKTLAQMFKERYPEKPDEQENATDVIAEKVAK